MSNMGDEIHVLTQEQPQESEQRVVEVRESPGPPGSLPKKYGKLEDGNWVQLTAAGVPRKKPGRKPGSAVKPRSSSVTAAADSNGEQKPRKPRKSRDPNAPPPRKRKLAPADGEDDSPSATAATASITASHPLAATQSPSASAVTPHHGNSTPRGSPGSQHHTPSLHHRQSSTDQQRFSPSVPKREAYPSSMQSILNAEPPSYPSARTSGQSYDPIRGNYDPVRETMMSNSPRAPTVQLANRSPSIASIIDPHQPPATASPSQRTTSVYQPPTSSQSRLHDHHNSDSMPASPSRPAKQDSTIDEVKKNPAQQVVVNPTNFTTIANGPVRKVSPSQKVNKTGVSTPKTDTLDDLPQEGEGRSILDFGKARPGEELQAPTIVLNIPIQPGEINKYVNVMRMAEDRYGWDALHPRLAANRDRKARIAAAAASLEKVESGRESGDEMSVDLSDGEASNPENGGTSGPDAQAKPKKKRNFKEDQYDIDDDFVDDSEMLWEAQAAASRDGFFVYSGPLVPEPEPAKEGYVTPFRGKVSVVNSFCTVGRIVQSAEEAAVVVALGQAVDLGQALAVVVLVLVAAPALEVALLQGNRASRNRRSCNGNERRPSERAWRSSTVRQRAITSCSHRRRLLLSARVPSMTPR